MVKHAEIISKEKEESRVWDKGVVDANSPSSLLNAVLVFSGNGEEEHQKSKLSQLELCYNPGHCMYTENCSNIFTMRVDSSMFRARLYCHRNFGLVKK